MPDFDSFEYNRHIKDILITENEIKSKIRETADKISSDYSGKPLLLVSILNGAFIFMADFCRALTIPCTVGFMCAKSYYNNTSTSGIVNITMDLSQDISRFHVIIVEDIIDTGRTLHDVIKLLKARNPLSLKVITLLDKPERRLVNLNADYSLFTIPDKFVIGYGLDYADKYRNLPYIAEYDESV
jgi:hypoxanthine phosphoribosyltransferase